MAGIRDPDAQPRTPLEQTFDRVRAGNPYLKVLIGPQPERETCAVATLLAPDAPERDAHFLAMAEEYKTSDPEVLVRSYLGCFGWGLASVTVGPYIVDRRVPVLDPAELRAVMYASGPVEAFVLPGTRFWCLPDDPAAGHPDAVLVADEPHLERLLREHLVSLCGSLITVLRPRARVGARALWIAAAESCAGILVDALPPGTTVDAAQARLRSFIDVSSSPLRARPEVIMLRSGEREHLGLLGNDCCVNFRIPGETYCTTCPHRPREERIAALQSWLAGQAAHTAAN